MKQIKRLTVLSLLFTSSIISVFAENPSIITRIQTKQDHEILKAAYEIGVLLGFSREFPTDEENPQEIWNEIKSDNEHFFPLFNFVCAQIYVSHLKELKEGTQSNNIYNLYDISNDNSPIGLRMREGTKEGITIAKSQDYQTMTIAHALCKKHLSKFLCDTFESSYNDIFNIKPSEEAQPLNPYYEHFCGTKELFKPKTEEPSVTGSKEKTTDQKNDKSTEAKKFKDQCSNKTMEIDGNEFAKAKDSKVCTSSQKEKEEL